MDQLWPTPAARHSAIVTFIHRDLKDSTNIIQRQDAICCPLDPPNSSPYKVIAHNDKAFKIVMCGWKVTVSADWVKPAYILEGAQHDITTYTYMARNDHLHSAAPPSSICSTNYYFHRPKQQLTPEVKDKGL
jgi:hypothetical protein